MDLSWIKELAERANEQALVREKQQQRDMEIQHHLAAATGPFVDKLFVMLAACAEEFNKYVRDPDLKVVVARVQKRTKSGSSSHGPEADYSEEISFFSFARKEWTFGVRGSNGLVEFLELPGRSGGWMLGYRMDEAAVSPSHVLAARFDEFSQHIVWLRDSHVMDGRDIIVLCQDYFKEFIERTNP
ncbi:MAG: hypothetical protein HY711_10740 [Candidatus Melainabacteria bacterium]|nr:hypothetical protein [Candidatus Melainabacteria bacterium]